MESSELLSGHLAWWLAGGALVLLLLLAPSLRRGRGRRENPPATEPVASGPGAGDEGAYASTTMSTPASAESQGSASAEDSSAVDSALAADEVLEMNNAMRLEVARVYMELDDADGAEAMLRQVVEEGEESERETAETMRREMAGPKGVASEDAPPRNAENLLDLATAYVEIGDARLARLTVEQIDKVGSETQRRQARALLDRLPD